MFRPTTLVLILVLVLAAGCRETEPDVTVTASEPESASPTTTEAAEGRQPAILSEGFSTPESVLYDSEQDVYFVSNINGSPTDVDDNGYISRINAETLQVEAKWIDGAAQNVQLHAPKGMAIVGDQLWVTDITRIARFDRRTGEPKGAISVPGTSFLNDLASDGKVVYVSDTGVKVGASGFEPTGSDAIWEVTGGKPKKLAAGTNLNRPNGLAINAGNVWVATFGAAEIFGMEKGVKGVPATLPQGGLDGLVLLPDGSYLVSSWDAKAVFRGTPGGEFRPVIENVESPADIGYDSKRNLVLVPHFTENRVSIHHLR